MQRHPGNVKYRKLVFVNKVSRSVFQNVCMFRYLCALTVSFLCYGLHTIQALYAKCPRADKIKISKVCSFESCVELKSFNYGELCGLAEWEGNGGASADASSHAVSPGMFAVLIF